MKIFLNVPCYLQTGHLLFKRSTQEPQEVRCPHYILANSAFYSKHILHFPLSGSSSDSAFIILSHPLHYTLHYFITFFLKFSS